MNPRAAALAIISILALAGGLSLDAQRPARGRTPGKRDKRGRVRPIPIKANVYADNWFKMYINGKLVAVDSIEFVPHNVISVDIVPRYPMTIAILAKDFADPETGLEWNNTQIGDGGFLLKLGDGTVTSSAWKAKKFSWGPLNHDLTHPKVVHKPLPKGWYKPEFDDSGWGHATEFTVEQVRPRTDYKKYDFEGAKFIWTEDLELDNTIVFRYRVEQPPNRRPR